jgi:hypothetical protein
VCAPEVKKKFWNVRKEKCDAGSETFCIAIQSTGAGSCGEPSEPSTRAVLILSVEKNAQAEEGAKRLSPRFCHSEVASVTSE